MRPSLAAGVVLVAAVAGALAQQPPSPGESLRYSVNWPSGLSLGEARLDSRRMPAGEGEPARREFLLTLEASVPGFAVTDQARSLATGQFCSLELDKMTTHGKRKTHEKTTFRPQDGFATRVTVGGGKSEIPIPSCARDALTFLFYVRQELAAGRLPPAQTILYGAPYQVRIEFGGTQPVRIGDARVEADRLIATVKGPASEFKVELFFERDGPRTPVLIKTPFTLGTFAMELVR
jgi:hypothetical protein